MLRLENKKQKLNTNMLKSAGIWLLSRAKTQKICSVVIYKKLGIKKKKITVNNVTVKW